MAESEQLTDLDFAKSIVDLFHDESEHHAEDYWGNVQGVQGMIERHFEALKKATPKHCVSCTCGKRAPVQGQGRKHLGPGAAAGTIDWEEHLEAYNAYAANNGRDQSPERIAERGGFGYNELVLFLGRKPTTWRPR